MKIALIDPSLFTWPYDNALAEGLKQNGHEVTLYTKHLGRTEQGKNDPFVEELFYPGFQTPFIKKLPNKLFLTLKGIAHIFSMIHLWIVLKSKKPDAIHFQWTPLAVIDQFFIPAFRSIAPTILTVHDSSPFNNNPSAKLQRVGAISIMAKFDHLIVHTEKAEKALIGYGLKSEQISRIPHGILDSLPEASAQTTPPAMSTNGKINLLLFGQVKPYKGTDVLIRALAKLSHSTRNKCMLQVIGRPQMEMEPLFALAKELGVENSINWDLRFVDEDEIKGIFEAADIMVMPYREIDASGVLMISLSVGRPIVASRIGLFAELLEDGKHGALTPIEDDTALAQALTTLIDDPDARKKAGDNVLALRKAIPDWKEIGVRTANLYQQIAPKS